MKALALVFLAATMVAGCATSRIWAVSGVEKQDRVVRVTYETSDLQNPPVSNKKAGNIAVRECKRQGYGYTEQSVQGARYCLGGDGAGSCPVWRVELEYRCGGIAIPTNESVRTAVVRTDPYAIPRH